MKPSTRKFIHFVIALALIGSGILGMGALKAKKQQIQRQRPEAPLPAVRTMEVRTGPQSVYVRGEGTVRPLRQIDLVPQVGGKVIHVSPSLVDGGEFQKEDILLRIDPADYELAVTLSRAKVKDAESRLKTAVEESSAAVEEWKMHRMGADRGALEPPPLVAREPQLMAAQANFEAEKADLKKAELNLDRTVLRAPFRGRVSQEEVGIGQYVSPGKTLSTLYATDAVEIMVPLESRDLSWIHVPGFTAGNGPGSPAVVKARIAGKDMTWRGRVVRTEGKLDEQTRMINVFVRVEDPYAGRPPLAIGLFVTVEIEGRVLENAAVIPRAALREGNVVWVADRDRLRFRRVEVARINGEKVILVAGLEAGEQVVVSSLRVATDAMAVRTIPAEENPS